MDGATLHAVDMLFLKNFLQDLLLKVCGSKSELHESLRQASALSGEDCLSPDCRLYYAKTTKRLLPLVTALDEIMDDLCSAGETMPDCEFPLLRKGGNDQETETCAAIQRFGLVERQLIISLNHIGRQLVSIPEANIAWDSQALIRVFLRLTPIPERPCYQSESMLRFATSLPHLSAHYFAEPPTEASLVGANSSWLIDSEHIPLVVLSLVEDIEIELEVLGDVVTCANDKRRRWPHGGKL